MMASDLEVYFDRLWNMLRPDGAPLPEKEYRFAKPRRWKSDFCWPKEKVIVEVEGGTWANGRHSRGSGYAKDCEKYNTATVMGYRVLRYTGDMLEHDPMTVIEQICKLLGIEVTP